MSPIPSPRLIPAIEHLRQRPEAAALEARYGREAVVEALRSATTLLREQLSSARDPGDRRLPRTSEEAAAAVLAAATSQLLAALRPSLRAVVNATGVIIHTNLGRAPLSEAAVASLGAVARGYASLEYDLERGGRGRRDVHAEALITRLTGAGAAVVVNNNAAATLLLLTALARGREVLISRGELVEIGGGFRVPDIMAQSGAILREVGTTNRTRVADYAAALSERTALILRVHPSNFRIEGFVERPDLGELGGVARAHGVPLAEDLGSGHLGLGDDGAASAALRHEPTVSASLGAGVDILCFSGDKLLGGPQAGLIVGREDLVATVRRHPLMRALRVDKLTYAALEATLLSWLTGHGREVPVTRMLRLTRDEIGARAERLAARLAGIPGLSVALADGVSTVGGGSAPGASLPTRLVALEREGLSADELEARLRGLPMPVIARIEEGRVVLDLRTVSEEDEGAVVRGCEAAAVGGGP